MQLVYKPYWFSPRKVLQSGLINTVSHLLVDKSKGEGRGGGGGGLKEDIIYGRLCHRPVKTFSDLLNSG